MSTAYDNNVNTKLIKLGAQALLLAPLTATAITARVSDITEPLSGWRFCGSINGSVVEITTKKELFTLKAGIPEVTAYEEIVGMEAQIKCVLNEWSVQNIWDCMGRPPLINTLSLVAVSTVVSGATRTGCTLDASDGDLFAVGDMIVVDTVANKTASANIVTIETIVNDTITWSPTLAVVPTVTNAVEKITSTALAYGDTGITTVQAAVVFDAKDGTQIVHLIPKCAMLGEYSPQGKSKELSLLPIQLNAYGVLDTDFNKTIVIKPLYFPAQ